MMILSETLGSIGGGRRARRGRGSLDSGGESDLLVSHVVNRVVLGMTKEVSR